MKAFLREVLFEAKTPIWKRFEVFLLFVIIASVIAVMLESVPEYMQAYEEAFWILEVWFTALFTLEYIVRVLVAKKPMRYMTSFYGVIDFLTILPTYLWLFLLWWTGLWIIRWLRLLRVFRIFKMWSLVDHYHILKNSLSKSKNTIVVFMIFVVIMVTVLGAIMYLIEWWENSAFDSIPRSIYRAIVTLTTVWYGDITPATMLGQLISSIVMILWYAALAVPTGIVTSDIIKESRNNEDKKHLCHSCTNKKHHKSAVFCMKCGERL